MENILLEKIFPSRVIRRERENDWFEIIDMKNLVTRNFKYSFATTIDTKKLGIVRVSYNFNIVKINWHSPRNALSLYIYNRIRNNLLISHASRLSN